MHRDFNLNLPQRVNSGNNNNTNITYIYYRFVLRCPYLSLWEWFCSFLCPSPCVLQGGVLTAALPDVTAFFAIAKAWPQGTPLAQATFFFLVSRTRHHSCAGHCFTIRSHCNFFRNATIPPGRIKQQRKTKQTATKQNQQRNTNQTQTENQTPEWKLSSLLLYNIQLK